MYFKKPNNATPSLYSRTITILIAHLNKHRSRTEIAAQLLEIARNGGVTKTRLMYGAYLSYAQIQDHLERLQEYGLLVRSTEERKYLTTDKGIQFLQNYDRVRVLIDTGNNHN